MTKAEVQHNQSYRLSNFRNVNDEVLLHGIDLIEGDMGWDPIIPCLGPLCDLGAANPDCKEFRWLREDRKWVCIRV